MPNSGGFKGDCIRTNDIVWMGAWDLLWTIEGPNPEKRRLQIELLLLPAISIHVN